MVNLFSMNWKNLLKKLLLNKYPLRGWYNPPYWLKTKVSRLFDWTRITSAKQCLEINPRKMKCISKTGPKPKFHLICDNQKIDQVDIFNYLGSLVTADGHFEKNLPPNLLSKRWTQSVLKHFHWQKSFIKSVTSTLKKSVCSQFYYMALRHAP